MPKRFFDVFPTLEVNEEMKKLLTEMEVTRVSMNREQTALRVYLLGTRLIHTNNIRALEKSIEEQIFKGKMMFVKIFEKYQLSGQYNARTLMDIYKDSIITELKEFSFMEANLLKAAKMEFTDDSHLNLTIENTIIAQTRSHEIVEFLEKVFCERCGMDLHVNLIFEEPKESKYRKNSELQMQMEIQNIMKRVGHKLNEEEGAETSTEHNKDNATSGIETIKNQQDITKVAKNDAKVLVDAGKIAKKSFENVRREFRKKSDNPDVIYGRDIGDDETIAIEKIVGEMGEVTIRCQVMTLDTREIRGERTIVIISVTDFTDSIVIKIFSKNEERDELIEGLKPGSFVKIKGVTSIDKFDSDLTIGSVVGIKKITDFTTSRMDMSPEKRVELH